MKKILTVLLILLIIIMSILVYGRFIGTTGLKTNEYTIKNNNIDTSYNNLKILHFSDTHYKKVITNKRIKELIEEINMLEPDIIVFTGDLLDKDYELNSKDTEFLISELSKLESKYGKYAVIGDNDYLKEDEIKNIYIQSNFTLLNNSYTIIKNENNKSILLAGTNSYINKEANINKITKDIKEENIEYKILLMHEPDYIEKVLDTDYEFNLILAGHSLNGSINIPFIKKLLLEKKATKYYKNYYKLDNTEFYISNGIGVSNINFRLFNHPSINLYKLKK